MNSILSTTSSSSLQDVLQLLHQCSTNSTFEKESSSSSSSNPISSNINSLSNPPTTLDSTTHPYEVRIDKDKITAKYIGQSNHTEDVGSIRSNYPIPKLSPSLNSFPNTFQSNTTNNTQFVSAHCSVWYYEVLLQNGEEEQMNVSIGIGTKETPLNYQIGTSGTAIGYHGPNGKIYKTEDDEVEEESYASSFGRGDVVGCGIVFEQGYRYLFFTKNGKMLGKITTKILDDCTKNKDHTNLYAIISLHGIDDTIIVNFGNDLIEKPFQFDVQAFLLDSLKCHQKQVNDIDLSSNIVNSIVQEYFLHYGYEDTLKKFEQSTQILQYDEEDKIEIDEDDEDEEEEEKKDISMKANKISLSSNEKMKHESSKKKRKCQTLHKRSHVRHLILTKQIDQACEYIQKEFPSILKMDSINQKTNSCENIHMLLQIQLFLDNIELLKTEDAIHLARKILGDFYFQDENNEKNILKKKIEQVMTLLAYENIQDSPFYSLLGSEHREEVMDKVNEAILNIEQSNQVSLTTQSTNISNGPVLQRLLAQVIMLLENLEIKPIREKENIQNPDSQSNGNLISPISSNSSNSFSLSSRRNRLNGRRNSSNGSFTFSTSSTRSPRSTHDVDTDEDS